MNIKLPLLFTAIFILSSQSWAQQVPSRMEFANMDLRLTAGAIRDIQADVDALTRSEKYFQKKLERVDMYLPIIERIFREEGLPDDFKYLVIQESALISDAVSSSNAVGFWQFKEISGLENDLRIDRYVDERMNIVASSRAAAAYLKSHNEYFDNWAYSLIAYQRGRGGAADVIDEDNFGQSRLKITNDTYWYLKKFLAHKVAFENAIGTSNPPYYLKELENVKGTTLKSISKDQNVPIELLSEYNKWIRKNKIPEDKNYTVILPLSNLDKIQKIDYQKKSVAQDLPGSINDDEQQNFPLIDHYPSKSDRSIPHEVEINGLDGIYAPKGYSVSKLAETAGINESKFRKFNDLSIRDQLKPGRIYYTRRKRNRAKFYYHTVAKNESMWEISQKYGLKLKKLYRKNRMEPPAQAKAGRILWLRQNRPSHIPIEYRDAPETEVENQEVKQSDPIKEKTKSDADTSLKKVIQDSVPKLDTARVQKPLLKEKDSTTLNSSATIKKLENENPPGLQKDTVVRSEKIQLTDQSVPESDLELREKSEAIDHDPKEIQEADQDSQMGIGELQEYSIKKGDTFFSISNKFNMKISLLLDINNLEIRDTLSIGQVIKVNKNGYTDHLPEKEQEKPIDKKPESTRSVKKNTSIKHQVVAGETMYALAKKYQVSLKEIMEWNDKKDYSLREGEFILIKQK